MPGLVPGIHAAPDPVGVEKDENLRRSRGETLASGTAWMAGTSPAMTVGASAPALRPEGGDLHFWLGGCQPPAPGHARACPGHPRGAHRGRVRKMTNLRSSRGKTQGAEPRMAMTNPAMTVGASAPIARPSFGGLHFWLGGCQPPAPGHARACPGHPRGALSGRGQKDDEPAPLARQNASQRNRVDGRDKPGHDGYGRLLCSLARGRRPSFLAGGASARGIRSQGCAKRTACGGGLSGRP